MAATNFTPIILYHTTTASATPSAGNLNNGELAINITDGKLFYKDNGGTVQVIATKGTGTIGGSNTQVQYNSSGALAGSANFTFNGTTATINTLNLTNALGTTFGGTGLNAYTTGDLVYASGTNTLAKLGIGLNTYILTSTGSVPQWSAPSAVTVATATNLAGGAAGSVPYQSGASTTTFLSIGTSGQILSSTGSAPQWSSPAALTKTDDTNVTLTLGGSASTALVNAASLTLGWTGQLSIARGGTNATATPTAGAVAYGTGTAYAFTSAGTSGQILTSSGAGAPTWTSLSSVGVTTFSAGTTGFTPSTATSGAITLAGTLATTNGGTGLTSFTANGVVYASSSSALATGSALTFDGTNLGVPAEVYRTTASSYLRLSGGNGAGNGANIIAFGQSHATNPNRLAFSAPSATATSYIDFSTAGAEALRITAASLYTASGINVGIGESTLYNKLTVTGNNPVVTINNNKNSAAGDIARLTLNPSGSFYNGSFYDKGPSVDGLLENVLTVTSALRFSVYNGNNNIEGGRFSADGTFRVKGAGTGGSTDAVQFAGSAPASSLILNSSGNLGVNRTSAGGKIEVQSTGGAGIFGIRAFASNIANPNSSGSEIIGAQISVGSNLILSERQPNGAFSDRTDLAFVTDTGFGLGQSEKARLTAGGFFGLNTNSPNALLEIVTAVSASTPAAIFRAPAGVGNSGGLALYANDTNANARNWYLVANSVVYGDFAIKTSTTQGGNPMTGTDRLYLDNTGSAALGASSVSRVGSDTTLYVQGSSFASVNFGVGGAYAGAGITLNSSNQLLFRISGGTAATLIGTNEFGIGVVPTQYKGQLQVGGTGNDMIVGSQARIGGNSNNGFFGVNGYYDQAVAAGKYLNNGFFGQLDFAVGTGIWTLSATSTSGTAGNNLPTSVPLITVSEGDTLALQGATQSTGTGIAFPATQSASSNANTLDDYEEGTFTPTIATGSANVTYTQQSGNYTKVGRLVTFGISLVLNTVTSVGSGDFQIGGLPFASSSSDVNQTRLVCQTSSVNFDATAYQFYAYTPTTSSSVFRVLYSYDNGSWSVAQANNFVIAAGSIIVITGFYYTNT